MTVFRTYLLTAVFVIYSVLAFAVCSAHAQTLTNADLGKKLNRPPAGPEVYAMLKQHEYQAPPSCTRCDGPYFASTGATTPYAGPWDWPAERPARRLDGTLVDSPPIVYGAQQYFPYYGGYALHSGVSERERARYDHQLQQLRSSRHENRDQNLRRR